MRRLIVTLILLLLSTPAFSQIVGKPIIANGTCDAKSGVTVDDGENSKFGCDVVVITRTERGTVLIQFSDKSGDDGRILGFAGTIEGKQGFGADAVQMLGVERLYLAGGATPVPVSRGSCIMNWTGLERTGGRLTSILCAARAQADGSDIKALAVLQTK
ncbi:MAG: hypothetical protein K2W81_07245 [Sphingomonas sp.]|uniref:hypothetical protein n=1 Tax=Sphingomonas sp. TaxID=28214 RepID=UPI0025EE26AE|nr:hypothetical protein [Sphingomonas sp.]MBY0283745.1 hypothetical protein [Sphingomonas sp.]